MFQRITAFTDEDAGEAGGDFAGAAADGAGDEVGVREAIVRARFAEEGQGLFGGEGHRGDCGFLISDF